MYVAYKTWFEIGSLAAAFKIGLLKEGLSIRIVIYKELFFVKQRFEPAGGSFYIAFNVNGKILIGVK